jgi:ribonuclease G
MKELVFNVGTLETRIAVMEGGRLTELMVEREDSPSLVGNIYRGKVDAVVPGMQAAFIDIGFEKNAFLYVSDIAGAEGTGDIDLVDGAPRAKTRAKRARQQPIETMLKKGQFVMVQVTKDRLGTKGARVTNFITMPGRFVVLMPTVPSLGVSRKIESQAERDRIKKILREVRPTGLGLVCRTAAEGHTKADIQGDVQYLKRVWDNVKRHYEQQKKPGLIREDLGPILRTVRDLFTSDVERLIVDDTDSYKSILEFVENFAPSLVGRVKQYRLRRPIFDKMGIEREIEQAMRRKVLLKSGGHICIDPTEALISIDVNTGKFTGQKELEDTVLQTNLEAAEEISRQLRLRDMGGIIVCDFIDMRMQKNKRKLIQTLQQALKADRAKTTISDVSELGLIEMTRKRVKHNLLLALSQRCPYCEGSGLVRSVTTVTFDAMRFLQSLFCQSKEKHIILQVHPDVARRLNTENKPHLDEIATRFEREIAVEATPDFHIHDVKVLRSKDREQLKLG